MGKLITWTVYDHPIDFPDFYIARKFKGMNSTEDIIKNKSLVDLQMILIYKGFGRITRSPEDDPVIVEWWF